MVIHAFNPSAWEAEVGESEVQDHLWLHSEFEATLGYMRPQGKEQSRTSPEEGNLVKAAAAGMLV